MELTNSSGISIDFSPWSDAGFRISKLHMIEKLGGYMSGGNICLDHKNNADALKLITEEQTGLIKLKDNNDGGLEYEIPIFITSREFFENSVKLQFVCIKDKRFLTDPISTEFDDITDALNYLYPGKIDIRTKSDINNNVRILQTCETNYNLCTRLAYSFKHNSIFSYAWEGFMLKELCGEFDSRGNKEPKLGILGDTAMFNTTPYILTYDKKINRSPYNPWTSSDIATTKKDYTDNEPVNIKSIVDYDKYAILGADYFQLHDNYRFNTNLMDACMYSKIKLTSTVMPSYKIGDAVVYGRASQEISYPFSKYVVASNELFYAQEGSEELGPHGLKFEWTSTLFGLDEGGWSKDNENGTSN